jgi:two-component system, chemotaxis family, protein-glutamate methylesterase/glutaminase
MPKKRILIVDDSVLIRRVLGNALSRNPGLEVAGSAANGRIALMKIPLLHPDVVILDVEMPEMDSLQTLTAIRHAFPEIAIIMLSVSTEQGVAATIEALSLGAKDYVTKPETGAAFDGATQTLSEQIAAKIDLFCFGGTGEHLDLDSMLAAPRGSESLPTTIGRAATRVDVLAIGVSTGGPNALMDLLSGFPVDFPVPILIVQHMPPLFTKLLAERLAARCKIRGAEGRSHQAIQPGDAWIAPGNFHMTVEKSGKIVRTMLNQNPPENSCRPAVDVLFRSVAKAYGSHALAVVMTGMGQDGLRGCQQIRANGGQVLAQDKASSVVWGMPGAVVRAGIADQVVSLRDLGAEITKRVWSHRSEKCALFGS